MYKRQALEAERQWPTPFTWIDPKLIPARRWIYGNHYIRSNVSVLASAGGVGKTSMQIVEALAIVTGKPLLGEEVRERCNVWIINLEDPLEEMQRRLVAAMLHFNIAPEDVEGRLFLDAGRDIQIMFASQGRDGIQVHDELVQQQLPDLGDIVARMNRTGAYQGRYSDGPHISSEMDRFGLYWTAQNWLAHRPPTSW